MDSQASSRSSLPFAHPLSLTKREVHILCVPLKCRSGDDVDVDSVVWPTTVMWSRRERCEPGKGERLLRRRNRRINVVRYSVRIPVAGGWGVCPYGIPVNDYVATSTKRALLDRRARNPFSSRATPRWPRHRRRTPSAQMDKAAQITPRQNLIREAVEIVISRT